jgi:hypothetical protein
MQFKNYAILHVLPIYFAEVNQELLPGHPFLPWPILD